MRIEYIESLSGVNAPLVFFRQQGVAPDKKMTELALQLGFEVMPEFSGREEKIRFCSVPGGPDILQVGLGKDPDTIFVVRSGESIRFLHIRISVERANSINNLKYRFISVDRKSVV